MSLGTELPLGNYHAIIPNMKPCEKCGGPHVATFSVGKSGYSCGSGHKCLPECPTLRCAHGVLWAEVCETCEDEQALGLDDDEVD